MCSRHSDLNGADSAQSLANAYALAEVERQLEIANDVLEDVPPIRLAIVPRCIACSEPALAGDVYCEAHANEEPPVRHPGLRDREPWSGGIAGNE